MNTETRLQNYGPFQVQDLSKPLGKAKAGKCSRTPAVLLSLVTRKVKHGSSEFALYTGRSLGLTRCWKPDICFQILSAGRGMHEQSGRSASSLSSRDQTAARPRAIGESRGHTRTGALVESVRGSIPSFTSRGMTPAPIYRNVGVQWLDTATEKRTVDT